jgi:hypothetical protein
MSSTPALYSATSSDIRAAVERIRACVSELKAPKLYHAAVAATVLHRAGRAQQLRAWDSLPTGSALRVRRGDIGWAIAQLFGAPTDALLTSTGTVRTTLGTPQTVVLDLMYDHSGPLTLVEGNTMKSAMKLEISDESWVWNAGAGNTSPTTYVEYNPVNSWGQQNGVFCALPLGSTSHLSAGEREATYDLNRVLCPHRSVDAKCNLNNESCAAMNSSTARATGKPRLMVPVSATGNTTVLLPGAVEALVEEATSHGSISLPSATDFSLVASWCHAGGGGVLDHSRVTTLLGAQGVDTLLEV